MKNILLTIEYDGVGFCGWQRQPGQRTVQGELERVLSVLCGKEIRLEGASRTDAGVHAFGQRATLRGEFGIPTERLALAANNLLSGSGPYHVGDVRIREAREMPAGFHARFDAMGKTYLYRIRNSREPDIMERNRCYHVDRMLDLSSMRIAAAAFVGEKDFRAFMAAGGNEPNSTVRTIYGLRIKEVALAPEGKQITLEVTGDGFLYNMVRIITGTLVDVGLGRIPPDRATDIIASLDRTFAGHTAPPFGLYLDQVYYNKNEMLERAKGDGLC